MNTSTLSPDRILAAALHLADRHGWEALHLHQVAQSLGVGLGELQRHVSQKDDLADLLLDRADRAMLRASEATAWHTLPVRERLARALHAWIDALAPHRRHARAMLRYRLQPEHLHLQARSALSVSRTVQWWREAAMLPAAGLRREAEEAVLTSIFLGTVGCWLLDRSAGTRITHAWLARQLAWAEAVALRLPR